MMDEFLVGKTLLNASLPERNAATVPLFKKLNRGDLGEDVKEDIYDHFFSQINQEASLPNCRPAQGILLKDEKLVEITTLKGKFFHKFGFTRNKALLLYPEEAIYLTEAGSLQVYDLGLPLSLQQLQNVLLDSYTFACYVAYCRLTRLGYILRRRRRITVAPPPAAPLTKTLNLGPVSSPEPRLFPTSPFDNSPGFLVASPFGLQRLVSDTNLQEPAMVQKELDVIRSGHFRKFHPQPITYDAYESRGAKELEHFAKSRLGQPQFVVVVVRGDDRYFITNQAFLDSLELSGGTQVVLAVIDNVDVSFHFQKVFSIPKLSFT
ncbi:tRNA splicing endonuclease 54 [Sparganum proliferum]